MILALLMTLIGFTAALAEEPARYLVQTVSADAPEFDVIREEDIAASGVVMLQDEWRQTEFFAANRRGEMQRRLVEQKAFEATHRNGDGWTEWQSRDLPSAPVARGPASLEKLETVLGVAALPGPAVRYSDNEVVGRPRDSFTLPLGGGVALYGVADGTGLAMLSAHLGPEADEAVLTRTVEALGRAQGLFLVDWTGGRILAARPGGGVEAWKP